jgi:glutamine amidotransferase
MIIGVVNNGMSNVGSVMSAFQFYRHQTELIDGPEGLKSPDLLVLAGVGSFNMAVSRLKGAGLWDALQEEVLVRRKPILGICLGMQLFASVGFENGENNGFGWIPGKVVRIEDPAVRVPHMGWDEVTPRTPGLFNRVKANSFYYMHSYHLVPDDESVIAATTSYGTHEIVAAVIKDNIVGAQFHPEKSQGDGMRFLQNVLETIA